MSVHSGGPTGGSEERRQRGSTDTGEIRAIDQDAFAGLVAIDVVDGELVPRVRHPRDRWSA